VAGVRLHFGTVSGFASENPSGFNRISQFAHQLRIDDWCCFEPHAACIRARDIRRRSPRCHSACRRPRCFPASHCHQSCQRHVTKFCLLSGPLAVQPCIRIGCREVHVIRAFLAMKVALGVASATACPISRQRRITSILGYKALHAGPCFDQGTVDPVAISTRAMSWWRLQTERPQGGEQI
jgi:hypothetical protein